MTKDLASLVTRGWLTLGFSLLTAWVQYPHKALLTTVTAWVRHLKAKVLLKGSRVCFFGSNLVFGHL